MLLRKRTMKFKKTLAVSLFSFSRKTPPLVRFSLAFLTSPLPLLVIFLIFYYLVFISLGIFMLVVSLFNILNFVLFFKKNFVSGIKKPKIKVLCRDLGRKNDLQLHLRSFIFITI